MMLSIRFQAVVQSPTTMISAGASAVAIICMPRPSCCVIFLKAASPTRSPAAANSNS